MDPRGSIYTNYYNIYKNLISETLTCIENWYSSRHLDLSKNWTQLRALNTATNHWRWAHVAFFPKLTIDTGAVRWLTFLQFFLISNTSNTFHFHFYNSLIWKLTSNCSPEVVGTDEMSRSSIVSQLPSEQKHPVDVWWFDRFRNGAQ